MLRVEGLSVRLGSAKVLEGVSFTLPGGYGVVVGPSGSGKTTLLRAIAGLVEYEGTVVFGGARLDGLPPWERGVALVQQVPGLLPHMSVLDNVALAAVQRRGLSWAEARRLARRLLEELGLEGLEARGPTELSGGQQQRAAIAAALATGAQLLLLDEPLSHLDRLTSEVLRGLLRKLTGMGVTVLHVTHDLDEALTLGEYIVVLHSGRVVTEGPLDEVYRCPRSIEAAKLLGHGVLDADLLGLGEGLVSVAPDYVRLRPGRGEWLVESVTRERGRVRVTARHVSGRGVLHAYHSASEDYPVPGERAEPILLSRPCRLEPQRRQGP